MLFALTMPTSHEWDSGERVQFNARSMRNPHMSKNFCARFTFNMYSTVIPHIAYFPHISAHFRILRTQI